MQHFLMTPCIIFVNFKTARCRILQLVSLNSNDPVFSIRNHSAELHGNGSFPAISHGQTNNVPMTAAPNFYPSMPQTANATLQGAGYFPSSFSAVELELHSPPHQNASRSANLRGGRSPYGVQHQTTRRDSPPTQFYSESPPYSPPTTAYSTNSSSPVPHLRRHQQVQQEVIFSTLLSMPYLHTF